MQVAGHFGELIQGRIGADLALISLPGPLKVAASQYPASGLHIHPPHLISPARARRFLADLGLRISGRIVLRAQMPIGGGAGSSTAALVALARLAGWDGPPLALARACLRSEGATDPLMIGANLLWNPRKGRILRALPPLIDFDILGGFYGTPQRTDPLDLRFPDISDLAAAWEPAASDIKAMADLCSQSAQRTLAMRGPWGDPTLRLGRDLGALGVVIAHTGTARGFIFAPGQVPAQGKAALRAAGLTAPIIFGHRGRV